MFKFSFKCLFIRVQELNEKANPEIIITIVGNKIDLENH
jgi:GTPase SAR1 family protein